MVINLRKSETKEAASLAVETVRDIGNGCTNTNAFIQSAMNATATGPSVSTAVSATATISHDGPQTVAISGSHGTVFYKFLAKNIQPACDTK